MSILINVLFICDEWTSLKGGLPTANRLLAINVAKWSSEKIKVYCSVLDCDDNDREDAERNGVTLVKAAQIPCLQPEEWLKFPPPEIGQLDVVVGHGGQFGPAAYFIKKYTNCKWVQFLHAFCLDIGKCKVTESRNALERYEEKHRYEIELCKAADKVVTFGPGLQSKYQPWLRSMQVEVITPGILEDFSNDLTQQLDEGRGEVSEVFYVFVFGRGTWKDLELKEYDIIGNAIASLGENFKLHFVGSPPVQHELIMEWFQNKSKITANQLTVLSYKTPEELKEIQRNPADLVALPSHTEGFGMTAHEALSGGVPILVSNQSGIAKALEKVKGGSSVIINGGANEWATKIEQLSKQTREERLFNAKCLRENYGKIYPWDTQLEWFEKMICDLVEASGSNGKGQSERKRPWKGVAQGRCVQRKLQDKEDQLQQPNSSVQRKQGSECQEPEHVSQSMNALEKVAPPGTKLKEEIVTRFDRESLSQSLIGNEWRRLGRQLDVDEAKLASIDSKFKDEEEKAYQLLMHWGNKNGSDATYSVLCVSLCNVSRKDLAQAICFQKVS
ncbi:hypothetical protein ACROYT_G044389 [Oculina patagonica]